MQMVENEKTGLGAIPINLTHMSLNSTLHWTAKADALVIAGGIDIHPSLYQESVKANRNLTKFDLLRDQKELEAIDLAFKAHKPIFAICRGHQLLSVYLGFGEDFISDLTGEVTHNPGRHNVAINREEPCHSIYIIDSWFANHAAAVTKACSSIPPVTKRLMSSKVERNTQGVIGIGWVNSYHHQGVRWSQNSQKTFASMGARCGAYSETGASHNNGIRQVVELMYGINSPWISTQWHPEIDHDMNIWSMTCTMLFKHMIATATKTIPIEKR